MIKQLNREKFLENLQNRMFWQAYTATDLENEIGVYSGYISRMKSDPQKLPALDIAYRMAQALDVSLEWLIEGSAKEEDRDGAYLRHFLERLLELTKRREMVWAEYRYAQIGVAILSNRLDTRYPFLAKTGEKPEDPVRIRSEVWPEMEVQLTESVWSAPLSDSTVLWMLPLAGTLDCGPDAPPESHEWLEMVLQDRQHPKDLSLLCSTEMPGGDYLEPVIQQLFSEILARSRDLVLAPEVKAAIDDFMKKTDPKRKDQEKNEEEIQ